MKRLLSLLPSFLMAAVLLGAAPSDYYKSCEGKKQLIFCQPCARLWAHTPT